MVILESNKNKQKLIFLMGQGLVGSAIVKELEQLTFNKKNESTSNWQDLDELLLQVSSLLETFHLKGIKKMEVVWSAGKAGFQSSEEETNYEYKIFKALMDYIINLLTVQYDVTLEIHLISSAGGLFEGMRDVGLESVPNPRRPYGMLKLKQEHYLSEKEEAFSFLIYRPTSLYDFIEKGKRFGLISTLIFNLINHKTSFIYGSYSTLRDYLWAGDLGRFIAEKILADTLDTPNIYFLASTQPATIFEIQKRIEKISKKRCFISFIEKSNEEHITFSQSCVPENFRTHALPYMIQRIYRATINNGNI
ncbi:MAG: NAD-dependent epimerase/dehydratase family protein [Balneolaceae bacterium]|nr:NAD-dependent epimerase/dehydratase family protein [Balneolaceae bacterium]